ncbi:hypothetical protein BJI67_10640 [Acidihalobacter aeolianus]|uniref:Glycosyltransferase RgtA/B/C/D-like domain-containing protein n=1 Tax=Acidihalobacter aeolianus TaxID=2792603 RepID=A0A1D8K904_9GAMM|nr:hypothetical protein BJI67_10640 [Acidihalobacter aeolianus]
MAEVMLRQHYLSDTAAFLLEKTYLVIATGRLESIGFVYPPLPFLLLLPGHSPAWLALISVATAGLLATLLLRELLRTDLNRWLVVLIASSIFFNPEFLRLATQDLPDMLGFLFLFLSFVNYEKYVVDRQIVYAFQAGLWLSAAFLATPSALYFLPAFVILLPFFSPGYPWRALLAAAGVLAFPTMAALGIWAYLSWLFTGQVAFAYPALYFHKAFFADWLWAAPIYWGTALLLLFRSPLRLLVHLVPLIMIVFSPTLGLASNAAVAALFTLFAVTSMPRRVSGWGHTTLLVAVLLQWLVAVPNMRHLLVAGHDEAARIDLAVGRMLARAPVGSVLTDDRQTYQLVALAGTAEPFLLPANSLYAVAELQPAKFCAYLLVGDTPGTGLYDYVRHVPRGMVLEARFGKYRLYRRRDAPPLLSAH